ncbi:putative quinol monooxygenase [Roseovarius aestuariivivens]|uniref:putative quinol monooxygenase n=1 Tax=Roseovarius aestuariivivens TaxID=1888910 RepID=UPI001081158B|nr:antibiotic biosynthesis monooxygenase [Roseovarius aestuariivivens]
MDTSDAMVGRFFAVNIKPEHRQEFLEASIFEAQNVISEEVHVFQFHFMEEASNPNRFYFYEVYRDDSALHEHRETAVFKTWWASIQHMLDGEVEKIAQMRSLFPTIKGFEAQKPGLLQW